MMWCEQAVVILYIVAHFGICGYFSSSKMQLRHESSHYVSDVVMQQTGLQCGLQ